MGATRSATRSKPASKRDFDTDAVVALREMEQWGEWADKQLKGLFIHIGPNKCVWRYKQQRQVNGKRIAAFKTLGYWPEMDVKQARQAGLIYAGSVASGTAAPGKKVAQKFAAAFEAYLSHLKTQAAAKGKPPRWYLNARKLADSHILPEWRDWTLYDMAMNPRAVAQWHAKLAKTIPTTADHCARLIRACYREEARLDRTLPAALPTSGIRFGKVKVSQAVLDFLAFGDWRKAWDKIENPVHKGYHLAGLLSGCRPGELAGLKIGDVDVNAMTLTLRNAKAGNDIVLPITPQILFAIDLAANAPAQTIVQWGLKGMKRGEVRKVVLPRHHEVEPGLVFPGCRQVGHRSGLPVSGNALRHTFRSIAVSLGISEMLIHFLMGHTLEGVSAKYTNELMVLRSAELRAAQEQTSRRIFELLDLKIAKGSSRSSAKRGVALAS